MHHPPGEYGLGRRTPRARALVAAGVAPTFVDIRKAQTVLDCPLMGRCVIACLRERTQVHPDPRPG